MRIGIALASLGDAMKPARRRCGWQRVWQRKPIRLAWARRNREGTPMEKPGHKPGRTGATPSPDLIAQRAVWAACFGFFVDMFDVYLPIAVLAPALAYFIPAGLSGAAQATIFYVVFAVTLIGRPLGAAIFGHF